jgi:hypothetical protein
VNPSETRRTIRRFDRSLGQALHFAVDDLDRPVDQSLLDTLLEDEIERSRQVFEVRLGETLRQQKSIR